MCCSELQCVAVSCSVLQMIGPTRWSCDLVSSVREKQFAVCVCVCVCERETLWRVSECARVFAVCEKKCLR